MATSVNLVFPPPPFRPSAYTVFLSVCGSSVISATRHGITLRPARRFLSVWRFVPSPLADTVYEFQLLYYFHLSVRFQSMLTYFLAGCPLNTAERQILETVTADSSCLWTTARIENKKIWEELIAYFPLIQHGPHQQWLHWERQKNMGDTQLGDLLNLVSFVEGKVSRLVTFTWDVMLCGAACCQRTTRCHIYNNPNASNIVTDGHLMLLEIWLQG
jgi:hypothetical protein